jgi:hypothetical protein
MTTETTTDEKLDRALRDALGPVPELPTELMQRTGRRARGAFPRPGEGTLSVRGMLYFWQSAGIAAVVLLAGIAYSAALGIQMAQIFGG